MEGGWREAANGTESSSRWAGGEEQQQLDGGAAYDWAGDSLTAVSSSAEATHSVHQGYQDRNDDTGVGIDAKDKKARRYDMYELSPRSTINWSRAMLTACRGIIRSCWLPGIYEHYPLDAEDIQV